MNLFRRLLHRRRLPLFCTVYGCGRPADHVQRGEVHFIPATPPSPDLAYTLAYEAFHQRYDGKAVKPEGPPADPRRVAHRAA
jgi:hypothetical protein